MLHLTTAQSAPEQSVIPYILLVEDDINDEALSMRALRSSVDRYDVVVAHDGEQAARVLGLEGEGRLGPEALPWLVVLDLKVPLVSGQELLQRIRSKPDTVGIPVLVFSGCREDEVEECLGLGASECLCKPQSPDEYVEALSRSVARVLQEG